MAEEDIWVMAAVQVLMQQGKPMHYLDIKRTILEKGLVIPGLQMTLEAALYKETQKSLSRLKKVENETGVFTLQSEASQHHQQQQDHGSQGKKIKAKVKQGQHSVMNGSVDKYQTKYKRLRKFIKEMVFMNAALCDEVAKVEEKVTKVKEERRYLLKKYIKQHTSSDPMSQMVAKQHPSLLTPTFTPLSVPKTAVSPTMPPLPEIVVTEPDKTVKNKKKPVVAKKKSIKDLTEEQSKVKVKKTGKSGGKRLVRPIPLDNSGRPIFPIELGSLTVHSLGEIMNDRPGFCGPESIYPVGFCSTREYANIRQPDQKCLYTCKILDGAKGPKFEISPEDAPDQVFSGTNASECHNHLLHAINATRGSEVVSIPNKKGAEFFGLTHPTVQNLIQSCPGARKCTGYKWVRFEIVRSDDVQIPPFCEDEPSICFEALQSSPAFIQAMERQRQFGSMEPSNLRSLLTIGPLSHGAGQQP